MPVQLKSQSRLHGRSIFLSASVPTPERQHEYERIPEAPLRIEEAVVCVARAVFMEGGTLVFGAHPSISPLVARVVDDYHLPAPAEDDPINREPGHERLRWKNPSVLIYQSLVWKPHWAEATEQLTRHPLVSVIWTEADPNETIDLSVKDRTQAPKSLERMREIMIKDTSPVAMVAIGGMKGVIDEAEIFMKRRPQMPIFALATTGGAAALLPRRAAFANRIQVVDSEAENLVQKFWNKHDDQKGDRKEATRSTLERERTFYVPYAVVAQSIVAQIIEPESRREWSPHKFERG